MPDTTATFSGGSPTFASAFVTELNTEALMERLKKNLLDAGLLVTPLHDPGFFEQPLYYEAFVAYVSPAEAAYRPGARNQPRDPSQLRQKTPARGAARGDSRGCATEDAAAPPAEIGTVVNQGCKVRQCAAQGEGVLR